MEGKECISWMEQQGILGLAKMHYFKASKVFSECLAAQKGDRILIIGDTGLGGNDISAALSACYYLYAKEKDMHPSIVLQKSREAGQDAEQQVLDAIESQPEQSIVLASMSNKLGALGKYKSFRKLCAEKQFKFATTSSLGYTPTAYLSNFMKLLCIDYEKIRQRQAALKQAFDSASEARLKSAAGTDLFFDISRFDAISADGDFREYGKGGNLPAGEVYVAPNENKTEGVLVVDASSRNRFQTALIKTPIRIEIKKGSIASIEGGPEACLLEQSLEDAALSSKYPERVKKVAELGIGMNRSAKVVGATIIDEKAYGTAHVAFGSNYWFGGTIKTIIHLDQVLRKPKLFLDGKPIKIP